MTAEAKILKWKSRIAEADRDGEPMHVTRAEWAEILHLTREDHSEPFGSLRVVIDD